MQYKFLIYISYSYAIPIGNPLEEEILKQGHEVKWFSDCDKENTAFIEKKNTLSIIRDVLDYSPHIILTISDSVPDFFKGLKVQIFHGFHAEKRPRKNNTFAHFRLRGFFDLYCTQGPNTTKKFKELQQKHKYFEVIETGWSKIDPLFPLKNKDITKTVMIASTFTERLSLAHNNMVFNEIKRLSIHSNFNFMMVLHPKVPKDIVEKWKTLNNNNFTYHNTTELIPLFKKADILFADTTSVIQEFLVQRKPVVTFNHTFNHKYLIDIKDSTYIEKAFNEALTYPEPLLSFIDDYIKELHPYSDGKSSQRIINASISYLNKDKSGLKTKPLNLIRKFKIRKKLKYFTFKSYNKPFTISKP